MLHTSRMIDKKQDLPQEKTQTIQRFVMWVHFDTIFDHGEDAHTLDFKLIIDLCLLAEAYMIDDLQCDAMDALIDKVWAERQIPIYQLNLVYSKSLETSPLRRYLVDVTVAAGSLDTDWDLDDPEIAGERYPAEFLAAVLLGVYQKGGGLGSADFSAKRSKYHLAGVHFPEKLDDSHGGTHRIQA